MSDFYPPGEEFGPFHPETIRARAEEARADAELARANRWRDLAMIVALTVIAVTWIVVR